MLQSTSKSRLQNIFGSCPGFNAPTFSSVTTSTRASRVPSSCPKTIWSLSLPVGLRETRWMRTWSGCSRSRATAEAVAAEYRRAKRSEQLRIAEYLQELHTTAGVLLVDAQGHGIISAKIASTVHDTFHAFMLAELDHNGRTTPDMFEKINLRLGQSVTARNALGWDKDDNSREIATMLYGEIRPSGHFRFVNFGHPPPLVFSAEYERFVEIGKASMAQFLPLGLEIPEDNPDRNRYLSMTPRTRKMDSSDVAEITLMSPGDILFLYTDGVYDGSDAQDRLQIEQVIREHRDEPAKEVCNAILEHAVRQDENLAQASEADRIDDKTVFVIKRR